MHQLFAPWRLLFSCGIAIALALSFYASLAALSPQPRTIALVAIMTMGILLPLGCVGLQRWLGRIRALDYVAVWSFVAAFAIPLLWIQGRALWLLLSGGLIAALGVPGHATILDTEVDCAKRCSYAATYQLTEPRGSIGTPPIITKREVSHDIFRAIHQRSIVAVHYLPAIPFASDIDGNLTTARVLNALGIALVLGVPTALVIAVFLSPRPPRDDGPLPPESIYQDPYLRFKWLMEALQRREPSNTAEP